MRPIHLDERLSTVASLVPPGSRVADIGCDHGLLICSLVESGRAPGGVACDLREGPLSQARHEINRRGLEDRISCRQGSGLSQVSPEEADVIVLAGMGGELIASILEECPWAPREDKLYILQPMTRGAHLRRRLCRGGYEILSETACIASRHPYTVMLVRWTGRVLELGPYDLYAFIGELSKSPSPAGKAYARRVVTALSRRETGELGANPREAALLRTLSNKLMAMTESW